ncbi:MAG: AsmA family protein [Amylibacter sp.]|nr:AsmA family protein [Amylibacter sp.]
MRWIMRIIMVVVVLVVAAIGLVFLLPAEKIGDLASDQLEKATGRKLTLSGSFRPTIYPVLGVKTGPLTISNADWASEPYMVSAQGASVGVGLSALLGGNIEVKQLILDAPVIHLERRADGVANWELSGGSDADTTTGGGETGMTSGGITLDKGAITNGLLTYKDATTQQDIVIKQINADFALPKSAAATINGSAIYNGRKANIDLSVADLGKLMDGQVTNMSGSLAMGEMKASLNGQAMMAPGVAPLVNGQYSFDLPDMASLQELTGAPLPDALKGVSKLSSKGTLMVSSAGINLSGNAGVTMNGLPIDATFEVIGPENWAETLRVDVSLGVTGRDAFTFKWVGLVNGKTGNADGTIDFNASDLAATLKAAGNEVGFPKGTGKTARVKGVVGVRDGKNSLSKATFALDQNVFQGDALLALDSVPYISANLTAGDLDFSAFTSDESGSSGSSSGSSSSGSGAWSKDPIRITGLDAINADINLKAKSVNLGVSRLGRTDIKARLRGGALNLTLKKVQVYGGVITGVVSFSGGNAVKFDSDIKAVGVQLEPLLGSLLDLNRLTGSGNTTLKMSGSGGSLYQIMHSLSGNGTLRIDKGSFKGIDLAAMMRNLKQAFGGFEGATEFTSLTGTFQMKKGVLQNVDMLMVSPLFKAEGKGRINVGEQNMTYTVTPSSLSENAKFSVPVDISGPWSNLKFRPDLKGLVDLLTNGRLEKEKAALEERAKAALVKKLRLQANEAVSRKALEDKAKQSLEDKAKDEVGNLLKGLFQ